MARSKSAPEGDDRPTVTPWSFGTAIMYRSCASLEEYIEPLYCALIAEILNAEEEDEPASPKFGLV
jgi:hypothetical protein